MHSCWVSSPSRATLSKVPNMKALQQHKLHHFISEGGWKDVGLRTHNQWAGSRNGFTQEGQCDLLRSLQRASDEDLFQKRMDYWLVLWRLHPKLMKKNKFEVCINCSRAESCTTERKCVGTLMMTSVEDMDGNLQNVSAAMWNTEHLFSIISTAFHCVSVCGLIAGITWGFGGGQLAAPECKQLSCCRGCSSLHRKEAEVKISKRCKERGTLPQLLQQLPLRWCNAGFYTSAKQ